MTAFDSRRGTRGARQPKGRLMIWANGFMAGRIRKGKNPMKFNILILTTTGRKSGAERAVPVGWFPDGNGNWLIVASANGAADNPAWYYNLAAAPDKARIEVDGAEIPVTAQQLHGAERAAAWTSITTAAPRFAQYESKTDRAIPVILLTRRADPSLLSCPGYRRHAEWRRAERGRSRAVRQRRVRLPARSVPAGAGR